MSKLYQTFQSPYSLTSLRTVSHYIPLPCLREFVVKSTKTCSFFWIFFYKNTSFSKTTDSSSFQLKDWSLSFFSIPIKLRISQPSYHVCCWWRKILYDSIKTLLLFLINSLKARKFCFSIRFLFFFLFFSFSLFWPIETTTTNLPCLTHLKSLKKY